MYNFLLIMEDSNKKQSSQMKYTFKKMEFSNNYYIIKNYKKVPLPPTDEIIKDAVKYSKKNKLSYFIQFLYEREDNTIKKKIFDSLKKDIYDLSNDFYGNYVIQTIINDKDEEKINFIYNEIINKDVNELCMKKYSSRVVQALLEIIDIDKIIIILEKIKKNLSNLFLDINGNYIIQKIISRLNGNEINDIYEAVLKDINILIKNEQGICVVQAVLKNLNNNKNLKKQTINLEQAILKNDLVELCKNKGSNYIIKNILEKKEAHNIEYAYKKLKGKINELPKNECTSYIIQILLEYENDVQRK